MKRISSALIFAVLLSLGSSTLTFENGNWNFHITDPLNGPVGTYKGSQTYAGEKVDATILIVDSSHMNLEFICTGNKEVHIDCPNEVFSISGSKVTLPGATDKNDCLYKSLKEYDIKLKSVKYDSGKDEFTIKVIVLGFVPITSKLEHVSDRIEEHVISFKDIRKFESTLGTNFFLLSITSRYQGI